MANFKKLSVGFIFGLFVFSGFTKPSFAQDQLPTFDASGEDGLHSDAGRDASQTPPRHRQTQARDGGDASRPSVGRSAGQIRLRICQTEQDKQERSFTVEGRMIDPQTGRERSIPRQTLSLNAEGKVRAIVKGGNGGNSASAGRGQPGAPGEDGRRAVVLDWNPLEPSWRTFKVRPPQRGTSGGSAGDAGNTWDGADAGDGGEVIIEVTEDQSYLLDLIGFSSADIQGGKGGARGKPVTDQEAAKGGEGGKGGAGITTLEVRLEYKLDTVPKNSPQTKDIDLRPRRHTARVHWQVWEVKRDEDGFPTEPKQYERKRFETSYEMPAIVPDARSGDRGRDGRGSPNQNLRDGRDGRVGKREIHVIDDEGNTTAVYSSPPRLEIAAVDIDQEREDGALMPHEKGVIKVAVKNLGGMPSAAEVIKLRVSGDDRLFFDAETSEISLPSLQPDETSPYFEVPFRVKPIGFASVSDEDLRARVTTSSTSRLHIPAIGRDIADQISTITIELPVSVTSVRGLTELRSGEAAEFEFAIKNFSSMAIRAEDILNGLLEYVDGSIPASEVVLVDDRTQRVDLKNSGLVEEIGTLAANGETSVKLKIGIPKSRSPGESFQLRPSVEIGIQGNANETSQISNQTFKLSVAHSFEYREESDLIVVGTSERGFRDQLVQSIEGEWGLEADVFDLGVEGVFHLLKSFPEKISDIVQNKTIVLAISAGDEAFLNRVEFLELREFLLNQSGRLLILNERNRPTEITRQLTETLATRTRSAEPVKIAADLAQSLTEKPLSERGESQTYAPTVRRFWPWSRPQQKHFNEAIDQARAAVDSEVPLQSVSYIGDFEASRGRGGFLWLFMKKYDLGSIEVTRTIDRADTRAVGSEASMGSDDLGAAIALALQPEKRLEHFADMLDENRLLSDARFKAFFQALYYEWAHELESLFRVQTPTAQHFDQLVFVNQVLDFDFSGIQSESKIQHLSQLMGLIASLGGDLLKDEIKTFVDRNFDSSEATEFMRRVNEVRSELRQKHGLSAAAVAKAQAQDARGALAQSVSAGLLTSGALLTRDEASRRLMGLRRQADRYNETERNFEQERARHLLPGGRDACQNLLEAAANAQQS